MSQPLNDADLEARLWKEIDHVKTVMLGLVGADYHFIADVLGGLLTGMACAWGSLVLMPARDA